MSNELTPEEAHELFAPIQKELQEKLSSKNIPWAFLLFNPEAASDGNCICAGWAIGGSEGLFRNLQAYLLQAHSEEVKKELLHSGVDPDKLPIQARLVTTIFRALSTFIDSPNNQHITIIIHDNGVHFTTTSITDPQEAISTMEDFVAKCKDDKESPIQITTPRTH